jgi:hypothetical protein
MVTRDHMDLGSSICNLAAVGAAHSFHTRNEPAEPEERARDDSLHDRHLLAELPFRR